MQYQNNFLNAASRTGAALPAFAAKQRAPIPPPPASPPASRHYTLSEVELATFRTQLCENHQKAHCAQPDACPHSHCLTWQRRNPYEIIYDPHLCPGIEFRRSNSKMSLIRHCTRGRSCTYAHSKEEELYHPLMYKTKICTVFPNCDRHYCPFAHSVDELRHPYSNPLIQSIWGGGDNSFSSGMQRWSASPLSPLSTRQFHDIGVHQHPPAASVYISPGPHVFGVASASSADATPRQFRSQEWPPRRQPVTPKEHPRKNPRMQDGGSSQSLLGQPSPRAKSYRQQRERRLRKKEDTTVEESGGAELHDLLDSEGLRQALILALAQQLIGPQVSQLSVDQILIVLDLAVKLAASLQSSDSHSELHEQATTAAISLIDSSPPNVTSGACGGQTLADDLFGDATSSSGSGASCRQALLDDVYPGATQALIAQLKKLALSDSYDENSGSSPAGGEILDNAEASRLSILQGGGVLWSTSTSPVVGDSSSRSSVHLSGHSPDHLRLDEPLSSGNGRSVTQSGAQPPATIVEDGLRSEQKASVSDHDIAERVRISLLGALADAGCQLPEQANSACPLPETLELESPRGTLRGSVGTGQGFSLPGAAGSVQKRSSDYGTRQGDDVFSPQTTTCSPTPFTGQVCSPQSRTAACTPAPPPSFSINTSIDNVKQVLQTMQQRTRADLQHNRDLADRQKNAACSVVGALHLETELPSPKIRDRVTRPDLAWR
ncbi:hypothetical protein BESB_060610 [Besnoitia besnoiti]|uniref:C3H1-type domain-containing protein n=1 Tax=Besnoitia besnoiti TaxID=94643 RepID=A0A2A9MD92_BESBE|nr:hypothetical protein BESB_060610 [Besnoitia besnoiti]PFH35174.1 hypothetical protein BESB_060610 [Besnoitia besnoiti]